MKTKKPRDYVLTKVIFFLTAVLLFSTSVSSATVSHTAEEIVAGSFGQVHSGNFSFLNGSVGIGTASPSSKLHVNGSITGGPAGGGEGGEIQLQNIAGTTSMGVLDIDSSNNVRLWTTSTGGLGLFIGSLLSGGGPVITYTNANERMRITADGKVGIGTVGSEAAKLHIKQAANTNADGILVQATGGNNIRMWHDNSVGIISSDTVTVMSFKNTGTVGIDNTAPPAKLTVGNITTGTGEPTYHGLIQIQGSQDITAGHNGLEFKAASGANGYGWVISSPDRLSGNVPLVFASRNGASAWTERVTMRSDTGNVGIGTNNPGSNRLFVYGDIAENYAAYFHNDGDSTNRYGIAVAAGQDSGSGTLVQFKDGDHTNIGEITFSGSQVTYGQFTGNHNAIIPKEFNEIGYDYGTVMCLISTYQDQEKTNQPQYFIEPCKKDYDKSVFGIYSNKLADQENQHIIYALGDGHILVTREGGNIEIGDYLTSSSLEGHAMKQNDDLLHSYTVAKATQPVDWSQETEDIKLIACTYHAA